jgi:Flp pilus assembly protein TadD
MNARIECYRIAADIRPDFPELHAELGKALLQARRVPESVAQFQTALRISPRNTKNRCLLGTALLQSARFDEAVEQFDRAVRYDPNSAMARDDLAVALWTRSKYHPATASKASLDEIKAQLTQAIGLRPDDPLALTNLGLILLDLDPIGGVPEANRCFVQALGIAPEDLAAHLGLSKTLPLPPFSNSAAAADHLDTARKLEPDSQRRLRYETPLLDTNQPRDPG